ncbi:MAG TPA: hypothetical protein VLK82_03760 [Candidatus Tectomicrobia bacterium]|nr:hypothetical protein [Candidatus Tectomicrobia bacterium]
MAVFKKQGVYWIDYYVNGGRKRERIGPDKKRAELVLKKRKVEIAEGNYLDKQRPITSTFDDLAAAYLKWINPDAQAGTPAKLARPTHCSAADARDDWRDGIEHRGLVVRMRGARFQNRVHGLGPQCVQGHDQGAFLIGGRRGLWSPQKQQQYSA